MQKSTFSADLHSNPNTLPVERLNRQKGLNMENKETVMEYIKWFIEATDDGTFESEDDLEQFVVDSLYDEFGDEVCDMISQAMKERK